MSEPVSAVVGTRRSPQSLTTAPRTAVLAGRFAVAATAALAAQLWLQATFRLVEHPVSLGAANLEADPGIVRGWYRTLMEHGTYGQMIRTEVVDLIWPGDAGRYALLPVPPGRWPAAPAPSACGVADLPPGSARNRRTGLRPCRERVLARHADRPVRFPGLVGRSARVGLVGQDRRFRGRGRGRAYADRRRTGTRADGAADGR